MINKLRSIIRYLIKNYPYPNELTKTRLTKLVYLIDWENVKAYGNQMTSIKWFFDHYGPYVSDVLDEADEDSDVRITRTISNFGTDKYVIGAKEDKEKLTYSDLTCEDRSIIDKVIDETKHLYWNDFISHVYSTEPIVNSERYSDLDLEKYY